MGNKVFKCAYKHCKHESCDIPQDDAVSVGNRYMHKDCAQKREYIQKTRDLYYEKVSSTVVMKQLVNVLNTLVNNKNVDPVFLYFALDFAISNKFPMNSPYSLHYIVDNKRIKAAWKKKKAGEIANQIKEEATNAEVIPNRGTSFKYTSNIEKGFGGIFGGK